MLDAKLDLMNPILYILKRWRILAGAMLIGLLGAGILCGNEYRTAKQTQEASNNSTMSMETIEQGIASAQKSCDQIDRQIEATRELMEFREDYAANSIKMKIDWEHEAKGTIVYTFYGENASEMALKYQNYLESNEFINVLNKEMGTAIKEFFWHEIISGNINSNSLTVVDGVETAQALLQVSMIYYDEKECRQVLDKISGILDQKIGEEEAGYPGFAWKKSDVAVSVTSDVNLKNEQANAENNANYSARMSAQNIISTNETLLEQMKTSLENWKMQEKEAKGEVKVVTKIALPVPKMIAMLLIAVLGLLLFAVCILMVLYILTDKIRTTEELMHVTKQNILTYYAPEYTGKNRIDRWVYKLERKHVNPISDEQFVKSFVQMIEKLTANSETSKITIVDAQYKKAAGSQLMNQVVEELSEQRNIELVKNVMFGDADFERILDTDLIILAAYCGYDEKNKMIKKIELLRQNNISCLGIVLL